MFGALKVVLPASGFCVIPLSARALHAWQIIRGGFVFWRRVCKRAREFAWCRWILLGRSGPFNILTLLTVQTPPSSSLSARFVSLLLFHVAESAGIHPKARSLKAALPQYSPFQLNPLPFFVSLFFAPHSRFSVSLTPRGL